MIDKTSNPCPDLPHLPANPRQRRNRDKHCQVQLLLWKRDRLRPAGDFHSLKFEVWSWIYHSKTLFFCCFTSRPLSATTLTMPSPVRSLQASLALCPLEKSFKTTKSFREVLQDYQALGQGLWIPRALKGWKGPTQQWVRERQAGCCDILTGHSSVICCYFA